MVTQEDNHNQAQLPQHLISGAEIPPANTVLPCNLPAFPSYPPSQYNNGSYKKIGSRKRISCKERRHRLKASSFDALIASHGTSIANRKPQDSVYTEVVEKESRSIMSRSDSVKSRGKKSYTDLVDLILDVPVACKRRKIQETVNINRDSAKYDVEEKTESIYDYMHYDPDKEALKKKTEKILSNIKTISEDNEMSNNTVQPAERFKNQVEEIVEAKEHTVNKFEDGLVIQTSVKEVEDGELHQKMNPVRYDYSKVNAEYPDYAVAGAITYRLNEKKQKLIHRVVSRIGKEKSLELLFRTEEIERNGGEMTARGIRRKEAGGVFLSLLKKEVPADDIKYIFTIETELENATFAARNRQRKINKKKRYVKNKSERNLLNALNNLLMQPEDMTMEVNKPVEPALVEPALVEPSQIEPAQVKLEPAQVEPAQVKVEPSHIEPAQVEPALLEPAQIKIEPAE